jgi:hypothetical protein
MTLLDRILLFSILSVSGIGIALLSAGGIVPSYSRNDHPGSHLCYEVAKEMAHQVEDELISQDTATRVIIRCFEKFGDSTDA